MLRAPKVIFPDISLFIGDKADEITEDNIAELIESRSVQLDQVKKILTTKQKEFREYAGEFKPEWCDDPNITGSISVCPNSSLPKQ